MTKLATRDAARIRLASPLVRHDWGKFACAVSLLLTLCSFPLATAPRVHAQRTSFAAIDPSASKGEVVERVVAIVNEKVILLSELRNRAAPILQAMFASSQVTDREARVKRLYEDLLDRLIDDMLIADAAKRLRIRIDDAELARSLKDVRERNQMSEEAFWEAVRAQGVSETQYREDVRAQMLRYRVLNQRVRTRVNITEEDVRRVYDREHLQASKVFRYRVAQILVALEEDASPADIARARETIASIQQVVTPKTFADQAREHGGGELGWLEEADLPEAFRTTLMGLKPGEISKPVRGIGGFHLFLLEDKEAGAAGDRFDDKKEEIYQRLLEESLAAEEKTYLRELRREAVVRKQL